MTAPCSRPTDRDVPQPKGLPLVGHLPALLRGSFDFFVRTRETAGDIYTLNLGFTRLVVLNHPRQAQHLLVDNARNYTKSGWLWDRLRAAFGNGLPLSQGDLWRKQRRLVQPHFHRQRLAAMTDTMVGALEETLGTWEHAAATATPLSLVPAFSEATMKVILRTMLGDTLSREAMNDVTSAVKFMMDFVFVGMCGNKLPDWVPLPGKKRYRQAQQTFNNTVFGMIEAHRQGQSEASHLLAMLIDSVDEETGEPMSDQQLRDEAAAFLLGGYETTSSALAWACHYLSQHPEVMQKLQAEVDQVLGERRPAFADLPRLAYTRMVLQETMRLRPSVWWVPRLASADDTIDGYHIPAGTSVVALTYMVHRHPEFWPDPERFDPERFTPELQHERHKCAWMPFGAGQRMCIGRDFAMMEGQLALAMIAQRYRLDAIPGRTAQLKFSLASQAKDGIWVSVEKRV
jgi:cytochrome P450